MRPRCIVYMLRSKAHGDRHYVGLASDVRERLVEHNAGRSPHTAKYVPWQLVVAVAFPDEAHASRFEKFLKSSPGRAFAERHFG